MSYRCGVRLWPLLLLVVGCATGRAVTCPDPIGEIMRDPCDDYKVQYETLSVNVGANALGVVGAEVEIKQKALQVPTELVQVMAHQAVALCRDYNSCRLSTKDYLQKREVLDRKYAAVAGIASQLSKSDIAADERTRLIDRLLATLGADKRAEPTTSGERSRPRDDKPRKQRTPRVWFGATQQPPESANPAPGFPRLVRGLDMIEMSYFFPKYGTPEKNGYIPRMDAYLYGVIEPDDVLIVDFAGVEARCLMRRGTKGQVDVVTRGCRPDEKIKHDKLSGVATVSYMKAATGETKVIGRVPYQMLSRPGDKGKRVGWYEWGVSYDHLLDDAWLLWHPEPDGLPADAERLRVQVYLRLRDRLKNTTMRCTKDGEVATGALNPSRGTRQVASYQDLPRYTDNSRVKEPFVEWWQYSFDLPWAHVPTGGVMPKGAAALAGGKYSCAMKVEQTVVRTVEFSVNDKGRIEVHAGQTEGLATPWFRVDVVRHDNDIEATIGQ